MSKESPIGVLDMRRERQEVSPIVCVCPSFSVCPLTSGHGRQHEQIYAGSSVAFAHDGDT